MNSDVTIIFSSNKLSLVGMKVQKLNDWDVAPAFYVCEKKIFNNPLATYLLIIIKNWLWVTLYLSNTSETVPSSLTFIYHTD
jgi:hypothetical protein